MTEDEMADLIQKALEEQVGTDSRETAKNIARQIARRTASKEDLSEYATEYHILTPEQGGIEMRAQRQNMGGNGWAIAIPGYGGGRAWTQEGWQDKISAITVDRLFCWPSVDVAVREMREALARDRA